MLVCLHKYFKLLVVVVRGYAASRGIIVIKLLTINDTVVSCSITTTYFINITAIMEEERHYYMQN